MGYQFISLRTSLRGGSLNHAFVVSRLRIQPLEQEIELGRDYLIERSLQTGHILPLSDKLSSEYFPADKSYLAIQGRKPLAMFSYLPGVHKAVALAQFRVVTDSKLALKAALKAMRRPPWRKRGS